MTKQLLLSNLLLLVCVGSTAFGQTTENSEIASIAERLNKVFSSAQDRVSPPGSPVMKRPVFGKSHGCLKATFEVNQKLPTKHRVGVFAADEYPAWIRFSNDGAPRPDQSGAARGLAIKLVGVPGKKILEGEEDALTQDFILQNHPVFFAEDAKTFAEFIESGSSAERSKQYNEAHPETQQILTEIKNKVLVNPLEGQYWTPTPYRLGKQAMKYMVKPCEVAQSKSDQTTEGPDYLRRNLRERISQAPACLSFYIQIQKGAKKMPIDRATILWDPSESPFIHAADLKIEKGQNVDDPRRDKLCENLSFTGWHALPEHEPLGSLNAVRKIVYKSIADRRRQHNAVAISEPTEILPED